MRTRRLVLNEESSEVQWTWKREALQTTTADIKIYSKRVIVEQIAEELKLIGDWVYQEFLNSCFGFLMRFDTQGFCSKAAVHWLIAHEVIKADAGPDELWYRVGGRFIRFSKYEYALVTGLSFRPTTFNPSAEHHPPASGLFLRHYRGRRLKMETLQRDFTDGVFRGSPADALKVAKLLIVYFLLFGMDGRQRYIDKWAWTLIEDSDRWETFMWGQCTYQILLSYLQRVPTKLLHSMIPSYGLRGFVGAFLIWAFEAIPELGNVCAFRASGDALPRCLRWRFFPNSRVAMAGFCDRQMEVQSMLEPSAEEQRQPYWEHIHDDLRSDVRYIHQDNRSMKKKKTTSAKVLLSASRPQGSKAMPTRRSRSNSAKPLKSMKKRKRTDLLTTRVSHRVADQEKAPDSRPQGFKASLTRHSCSNSATPMIVKRKRTDPLSTRASPREADQEKAPHLSEHECGCQDEMTSIIRQEFFSQRDSLPPRHTPDDLPVGGASSSIRIARPRVQYRYLRHPVMVFKRRMEDNMNSEPELSNVAVGQAGRNTSIFELMEKINELKNRNLENERLMGVHEEKCKCLDIKIVKMGQEMEELRQEKLEADQVVKELKHGKLKADKTIDELRLEKSQSDKVAELYKSKLMKLLPRIKKIEEHLANIMKVGDLSDLVNDARKLATSEDVGVLDFPDDAENLDSPSPVVRLTFNSSGLSKKGDRNLADAHNTFKTSSGSQSGCNPQPKSNECKDPQSGSGTHAASGTRLMSDKISAENLKVLNEKNYIISGLKEKINELRDINLENERLVGLYQEKCKCLDIKIVKMGQEVEDEKLASIKTVKELRHKNIEANKTIDELRLKISESDKVAEVYKSKLDKVTDMLTMKVGDFANLVNDVRELATSDDAENVVFKSPGNKNSGLSKKGAYASGTRLMSGEGCFSKIVRSSSAAAGDIIEILDCDDKSLSDSRMHDVIASLRSEKLSRKWMYEADLLRALQEDEELCMNAVCALYRQQAQLKGHSANGGFSPVDMISGRALAEYLIGGDRELRLRKSVSEVKKERPDVISRCRKLATIYVEKLFQIYCEAGDPIFGQS